jgi:hypothetical protein
MYTLLVNPIKQRRSPIDHFRITLWLSRAITPSRGLVLFVMGTLEFSTQPRSYAIVCVHSTGAPETT